MTIDVKPGLVTIKSIRVMHSIDHFDLRTFDLNLLVAFDALIESRSVTRAAARLKVGQPAMSHSLATLRLLLQDELFVRVGTLMQPTARATVLAEPVRLALETMQAALHAPAVFDPATEERTVRLGFSSEVELLLLPDLAAAMRSQAPGVRLLARPAGREVVHRLLDERDIDLAVGCFDAGAQRHPVRHLFEQSLSCVFDSDLVPFDAPITLVDYLAHPHALVTLSDNMQGCLDGALDEVGAKLNVVAGVSEFLSVLATATRSPIIATVPARMAHRYAPTFGLTLSPVPLALRLPDVSMVWSARNDRDAAQAWLRDRIVEILLDGATSLAATERPT